MPYISKIQLPGSNTAYIIKDEEARTMISEIIAGGVTFIIAWDGASTPVPANIPKDVQVVYNGTTYTGTLEPEGEGGAQARLEPLQRLTEDGMIGLIWQRKVG